MSSPSWHDVVADGRDRAADLRDDAARNRDTAADERDRVADERDRLADERDRAVLFAGPGAVGDLVTAAHLQDAASARRFATSDRASASRERAERVLDRRDGARDREDSELDRVAAELDRHTSADDRFDATLDALTGALHRGPGLAGLELEVQRALLLGCPLVVVFVDVDGMKLVNDTRGHLGGDQLLVRVVQALRTAFRAGDAVIRVGGDEFVCVVPGVGAAEAQRRLASVNPFLAAAPGGGSVTLGVTELRAGDTGADLVARADAAMYRRRQPPG